MVQGSQRFWGRGMKVMVMYARRSPLEQQRACNGTVRKAKGRENCPVRLRTHQREGHGEALRCVSEVEMFGSAYV